MPLTAYHLMPFTLNGLQPVQQSVTQNHRGKKMIGIRKKYLEKIA